MRGDHIASQLELRLSFVVYSLAVTRLKNKNHLSLNLSYLSLRSKRVSQVWMHEKWGESKTKVSLPATPPPPPNSPLASYFCSRPISRAAKLRK